MRLLYPKTLICRKCGRPFTHITGGVAGPDAAEELFWERPICGQCGAAAWQETVKQIKRKLKKEK